MKKLTSTLMATLLIVVTANAFASNSKGNGDTGSAAIYTGAQLANAINANKEYQKNFGTITYLGVEKTSVNKVEFVKCLKEATKSIKENPSDWKQTQEEAKKLGTSVTVESLCQGMSLVMDLKNGKSNKDILTFEASNLKDSYISCDRPELCNNALICNSKNDPQVHLNCGFTSKSEPIAGAGDHVYFDISKAALK